MAMLLLVRTLYRMIGARARRHVNWWRGVYLVGERVESWVVTGVGALTGAGVIEVTAPRVGAV